MRKEKKKADCFSIAIRSSVIVLLFYHNIQVCSAESNIIGSSVVTSVSVILNNHAHNARSNKEVSMDEVTTNSPPLIIPLQQADLELLNEDSSVGATSTPQDEIPLSSSSVESSSVKVPSPIYIHSQPVAEIQYNAEAEHQQQEDKVDNEGVVTNPPEIVSPSPSEAPPSPEPSPPSLPAMEEDPISVGTLEPLPSSRRPTYSTLPPFSLVALSKSSRRADDDGIRVIDALKDIVRQAQKQHASNDRPIPSPITLTLTDTAISKSGIQGLSFGGLPPVPMPIQDDDPSPQKLIPGTGLHGDDDDEMEVEVNAGALDPAAATTDAIDDFAKVVVMVQPEDSEAEIDNETAPSSEVVHSNKIRMYKSDIVDGITASVLCQHRGERADLEECGLDLLVSDAMHKISGAILSNDDVMMQRPVENIVNDVLSSINSRNSTTNYHHPHKQQPTAAPITTTTTQRTTTSTTTTTTTTTTPKPTTTSTTTTTTTTPRPTTQRATTTSTTTPRPTTRLTTTTTTTTPRPTTQVRTTQRPTSTSTHRPIIVTAKTLPPRTTTQAPRTTPPPVKSSTFLPRITPKVTPGTTPRPTTTTTMKTTTTTRQTPVPTQKTTTTLRPRPPQTTESFPFGNLFNSGLDAKTQQTLASIVKKDKPVMYSPDKVDPSEIMPPPFQGAPPASSTTKAPMPTTTSTTTTTKKPMSALEVMIQQAEQMGRPFTPMVQQIGLGNANNANNNQDAFDVDPTPVSPPKFNQQLQQQQPILPLSPLPTPKPPMQQQSQQQPIDYRIPGIPVDITSDEQIRPSELQDSNDSGTDSSSGGVSSPGSGSGGVDSLQSEDNELDQEDFDGDDGDADQETETPLKPYVPPTKKPLMGMMEKKPVNETTSSKRPNEFYDDEIFGFDPYQTFHHGVYVPLVEIQPLEDRHGEDSSSEEVYIPPPTSKPKRRKRPRPGQFKNSHRNGEVRPYVKHGKPTRPRPSSSSHHDAPSKNKKKPVPTLPDYLHRPRPSHLQYQHGAADDTDPLTGLLNPNYKHPGESYGPETQTFVPDRLLAVPSQSLPQSIRKNLTDHHDHHYQHQHGLVVHGHGGHGHGGGGAHGGGSASDAHGHSPNIPNSAVPHQSNNQLNGEQTVVEKRPDFGPAPPGNPGLEATLTSVDPEMRSFVDINNRIALRLFSSLTNPVSKSSTGYGNMVVSPFTITSSLSMLFLGARGNTASQLDGLLRLDDMLTFNPHMMYHNITQAFLSQPNTAAAMIRLLIADKGKGGILDFYRTRVQHFYDARVEQADYKFAGHLAQSIINQMIRAQIQRHSYELLNYSIPLSGPMSLITAAFFDGQFAGKRDPKVDGMNFIHLAALGRRLFPVPALSVKGKFRASYDNNLDATAVEIPYTTRDLSLIVMMPGKPGEFSIGGVASLKSKLTLESWTSLMRGFYPRDSFKVVLPRFRHQTAVNLTYTLKRFGLTDLFQQEQAQFKGINGLVDLFVDENMMHFSEFGTWEKLSDTMRENSAQNDKNLDLIRILRPYVKDQYGHHSEPLSVNDWMSKPRTSQSQRPSLRHGEQRSRGPQTPPQSSMDIRLALRLAHAEERMKRRQAASGARSNTNPRVEPMRSFMRPKGKRSKSNRRHNNNHHHHHHHHNQKNKLFAARQEPDNGPEVVERVLKFERPFIYLLRHNPTGMILMTGQYTEPVTEVLE